MSLFPRQSGSTDRLRDLLAADPIVQVPGCFDALSARMIERAGFQVGFLGGFSVAATRLGLPDVGLLSYGEMIDQARNVCAATSLPIIGDADTGYGNAVNAERTLLGCVQAGLAGVMIEDQHWPKRCGHTPGKQIVGRSEALQRIRACVRAREEHGLSVLIMARTDANATDGFDEALWRAEAFADAGADITFVEALESTQQMERYCKQVPGWKTANLVEDGATPWLEPEQLEQIGYALVLYPVSLLMHTIFAMQTAAEKLSGRRSDGDDERVTFEETRRILEWPNYDERLSSLDPSKTSEEES
jgi:2-methylisocitrate lyase-like PEP mutase family enzyme